MKKTIITLSALFLTIASIAFARSSFPDVNPGDWFHGYVMEIKDWGIVNGNDDGYFNPGDKINRAEFSKMLSLYDEHVDNKIAEAMDDAAVSMNETSSSSKLASIMYITRDRSEPNSCPNGWNDAGTGHSPVGGNTNFTRTCYVNKACTVMYLSESQKKPNDCPGGWLEASVDSHWSTSSNISYERICYVCE